MPLLALGAVVAVAAPGAGAARNPLADDPAAIEQGRILFRGWCGPCHGPDAAGGVKGPDLTSGRWLHGGSDAEISRTMLRGVPGTQMPASDLAEDEAARIVAFLRSRQPAAPGRVTGDPAAGEKLFWGEAQCGRCHMVGGRGGRLGPELTRVGAARAPRFLAESIREPSRHLSERPREPGMDFGTLPQLYATVTATLRDGEAVTGVNVNEDAFSIVVMDAAERLHSFAKRDLRALDYSRTSLMPAYDASALPAEPLQDLLAYLDGLRGR